MKKVTLLFSSFVFTVAIGAQNNSNNLEQVGNNNSSSITQVGNNRTLVIH